MADFLLAASQRKAIKDIFGDLITNFDLKIPRYEQAEKAYDEALSELRSEMKRLHTGLEKLGQADTAEKRQKIKNRMVEIAKQDISEKLAAFVDTFTSLVLTYGEK